MSALTWSPTIEFVRNTIANQGQLRLLIAPFIKLDALRQLIEVCQDTSQLQVIVRWTGKDLVTGVSDIEIYPYLREKGIALFRHESIHLKLFVYSKSLAFHTSGNITLRGLGLSPQHNLEIGCPILLEDGDWKELYGLLAGSQEIDEQMYEQALAYTQNNRQPQPEIPTMILRPAKEKAFSKDSLPACENPELLYDFYSGRLDTDRLADGPAEFVHDLITYSIPKGLDRNEFFTLLGANFKSSPFIEALVSHIRTERTLRFGAVNAWIAENCSDSPRPFRRDLKTTTRHLYNWLSYFFDEIRWDQPNVSMIIYWQD
jgi:hypothetical protein